MSNNTIKTDIIFSLNQNKPTIHHISLTELCKEHLDELAGELRLADRRELWACYRLPAREGLALCARRSVKAFAFFYRGKIGAAAGIEPLSLLGSQACVWSWTGEQVLNCPKSFFRVSQVVLNYFKQLYPHLYAACDERYETAQHYLERLGAHPCGNKFFLAGPETRFIWYQWP